MIEFVPNSISRDQLGKKVDGDLYKYFQITFGPPHSKAFQQARNRFISSMAAYAVVCFILQVKDRNNGNILIDAEGHVIHIGMCKNQQFYFFTKFNQQKKIQTKDFGFMFESSPGGNIITFELAPFKLSTESKQPKKKKNRC